MQRLVQSELYNKAGSLSTLHLNWHKMHPCFFAFYILLSFQPQRRFYGLARHTKGLMTAQNIAILKEQGDGNGDQAGTFGMMLY